MAEIEAVEVRAHYGPCGGLPERLEMMNPVWPERIAVADRFLDAYDSRWMQVRGDWLWFLLSNGFAQYEKVAREEWHEQTLFALVDGDKW